MLDSKVVPGSYQGSLEFNLQSGINYWQTHPDSNYGLVVLVEDAQGMALPPALYIQQMNCSGKWAMPKSLHMTAQLTDCLPQL